MATTDPDSQKILDMFQTFDRDCNDQLSVEELAKVVYALGWPDADATPEKVKTWFKDVDLNKDGMVSKGEFLQAYGKQNLKDRKSAQLRRVFKSLDKDGNNWLSAKELTDGLNEVGFRAEEADVKEMLEKCGSKSDRFDIQEFVEFFRRSEQFDKHATFPLK